MIVPGLSQATSVTDANLLHIPASSVVTRVVITNNGVTVTSDGAGANTSVGTYLTSLGLAQPPTVYFIGSVTQNGVNAGRAVGGSLAVSNLDIGTTGAPVTSSAVSSVTTGAGDSLVGIQITNANMLTGSLRVTIDYTNA